jgi:hypothetical protein
MGQYYLICNLDKHQFLHPQHCGDGLKLTEFGCSGMGTLMALTALLADGNGQGSGDLQSRSEIIGSWAGNRIVIAGDYADQERFPIDAPYSGLYEWASAEWLDVSYQAMRACMDDESIRLEIMQHDGYLTQQHRQMWLNPPPLGLPTPS